MRAVGTRSQRPGEQKNKSGKCTPVGMFAQINMSWKQRGSYSLGILSSAQLVSHLSNIPAVGKPLEIRDVTNPFVLLFCVLCKPSCFVVMSSVERLVRPLLEIRSLRFEFDIFFSVFRSDVS